MELEGINNYLNEKRKSMKRRSSIATSEVLKLMNMSGAQDRTLTESELLERVVNIQYNWIDSQLNELKRRAKSSSKKLTASSTLLATMGSASEDAGGGGEQQSQQTLSDEQLQQQLTDEQREFLRANEINGEVLDNLIKRLNVLILKSEMRQTDEQSDPKVSSLLKKLEACSLGSSSLAFRGGASSAKDPLDILKEYFES